VVADRYELLSVLGEGLSGRVYKARDLYVGVEPELVALKILHHEHLGDRQLLGRFKREAAILKRLDGPHLCRLLDVVEEPDLFLVALEYADGPSLDAFVEARGRSGPSPLPLSEVVSVASQIGSALQAAHEKGVIHRDLKPSNVIVAGGYATPEGSFSRELSARVVDFGLAKLIVGDGEGTMLTEHGMIFGTPEFMAPEQVAGEPLDARSDVYAFGVLLFWLLTGAVPFERVGPVATMTAQLSEPPPKLCEIAQGVAFPESVEAVIGCALAKAPDERYPSVRDLVDALVLAAEAPVLSDIVISLPSDSLPSDTVRDAASGGTTLHSLREAAQAKGRGARVQVIVPGSLETTQASLDATVELEVARSSKASRPALREPSRFESDGPPTHPAGMALDDGRAFKVLAVLVSILAVVLGAWLGLR